MTTTGRDVVMRNPPMPHGGGRPYVYPVPPPVPWRVTLSNDPTEQDFLATLRANPADEGVRLVYADWLEQRGRTLEASFVRHLGDLPPRDPASQAGDVDWRRITSRGALEMCGRTECPNRWDLLAANKLDEHTRECRGPCQRPVRYCATSADATAAGGAQRCTIALDAAADADDLKSAYTHALALSRIGEGQGTLPR